MTRITWTPTGETGAIELDLDQLGALTVYQGFPGLNTAGAYAVGGGSSRIVHGVLTEYRVEIRDIEPAEPELDKLLAFSAHAQAGGPFSWAFDSAQAHDTTLTAPVAQGGAVLAVADAGSFAANQRILVQSGTTYETKTIVSVAALNVTVQPVTRAFPAGSVVRHFDYWPVCYVNAGSFLGPVLAPAGGGELSSVRFIFRATS